jgi:pyruvate dehydrogenase E1 component alpha subunit
MGTSIERASATVDLSQRGRSFDIPGEQVDGMDVRLVKDASERAIAHAREGNGPYILEMMTYRYRGHSMSDPAKYRSKDEVTSMRAERDPIEQVKNRIIERKFGTEDSLKEIETEVRKIVTEAADFATSDPEPDASELWTDIYATA